MNKIDDKIKKSEVCIGFSKCFKLLIEKIMEDLEKRNEKSMKLLEVMKAKKNFDEKDFEILFEMMKGTENSQILLLLSMCNIYSAISDIQKGDGIYETQKE